MALLAIGIVMEIIIWITAIYIMDGGIIRQLSAMGLYATNIGIITTNQLYVSDLTATPQYASLFLSGSLLVGWALVNIVLIFVTMGFFFQTIVHMRNEDGSVKSLRQMMEEDLIV